ncbi:MAG TPA: phosphoribosylamine--glycine ligase [Blastocatellia bacterium]|nr:phosphoribosylamine--glycine ligase [Blastocatellia bacterium]
MKILVIGSGGREHALVWKLAQSPLTTEIFCAPGNAGIAEIAACLPADVNDAGSLATLAESIAADLTIVGPEAPLVFGVAEAFAGRGLRIVGPTMNAARLEGSKIFAKQFMARHAIPTAQFTACHSVESARAALEAEFKFPVVVKADGLAAGKGVRIAQDRDEFDAAINAMMAERVFGEAGSRVVLEECLVGREASVMIFTDGRDYKVMAPAQDYKRVFDGDKGANTGGMGSFSTPGLIDDAALRRIMREIIEPTLTGMLAEGNPFIGMLYAGLMLTDSGPKVIEYNARLGDPETQVVMARLESDLVEIFNAIAEGRVASTPISWSAESAVCVVAASGGYPGEFEKGKPISGLSEAGATEGAVVFHAGTARDEQGRFLTAGGRVLGVTARAATLEDARARAYEAISKINFDRMHYRKDIALTISEV